MFSTFLDYFRLKIQRKWNLNINTLCLKIHARIGEYTGVSWIRLNFESIKSLGSNCICNLCVQPIANTNNLRAHTPSTSILVRVIPHSEMGAAMFAQLSKWNFCMTYFEANRKVKKLYKSKQTIYFSIYDHFNLI